MEGEEGHRERKGVVTTERKNEKDGRKKQREEKHCEGERREKREKKERHTRI